MKKAIFLLIFFPIINSNCSREKKNNLEHISNQERIISSKIPDTLVGIDSLVFQKETSVWKINNELYSGYVVSKYENGSLKQKFGVLNGKKENEDLTWFQNGKVRFKTNYHKGKIHGKKKIWSQDSLYILIADYNYHLGKGHGKQTKWYSTGELYQILNLQMGREEGIQQAFRKNGVLYANYEAKNGRTFGLKKASLCFELKDQKIKDHD